MKKLLSITLIALITMSAFSQKEKRGFKKSTMTPEQIAELQTKKMTLGLELNESQQNQIYDLNKEQAIKREAKRKERQTLSNKEEKPTEENSFERKNARLDTRLAHQESMKKILNDDQYQTWKKSSKHKGHKMKKKGKRKMMKHKAKKMQERKRR